MQSKLQKINTMYNWLIHYAIRPVPFCTIPNVDEISTASINLIHTINRDVVKLKHNLAIDKQLNIITQCNIELKWCRFSPAKEVDIDNRKAKLEELKAKAQDRVAELLTTGVPKAPTLE